MFERDWLCMTKTGINYTLFKNSCLVSVNGFIHMTDTDGTKILVQDGAKSGRIARNNQVGITSFADIGQLEMIPITADMVHRRYTDIPLKTKLYIDIGTPKPNKTAMLVLGGYLHVLDDSTFSRISDSIFTIDFQNFPLLERYYESSQCIDLSSLGLDVHTENPFIVNVEQLYSDEVLTKYATLSQSFLVFIDTDNLFTETHALHHFSVPGMITSHIEPIYPLITGYGALGDYWRVKEDGQWALTITKGWQENYLFQSTGIENLVNVSDTRCPENPANVGRAHFLKIGTDIRAVIGA